MFASYRPILSLLRGTSFLLAGSGLLGLLVPLRGQADGFSTTTLGLLGTAWAGGFVAGCFLAPRLVQRAGHVRAFGTFASICAIVSLLTGLIVNEWAWLAFRAAFGFSMAGCFMIIESWLNERSSNESRGGVFALYMIVSFTAITLGQLVVAGGEVTSDSLFMIAGILYCCSLIPTAISVQETPRPLQQVSLDLKSLYANSPVSFGACILIGVANGAWGTLGAVYGARIGISTGQIALMASLVVIAGAVMQLPVGRASDMTDRRYVLAAVAATGAIIGLGIFAFTPHNPSIVIAATAAYGAMAYTLYPVAVAHANDHANADDFGKISGGLLLLYGFGTIAGPVMAAALMGVMRPESIFLATAGAHSALAAYTILRISRRAAVPIDGREAFKTMPVDRAATPETTRLDPRSTNDG